MKGLAVTAKNFFGSYHDPSRLVTVEYPEQRLPRKENTRSFPFLVFDGDDASKGLRCVACKICENECPPQCIYIVIERDANGKPRKRPKVFDIDLSVCMSCAICVEACPFDAIKMDVQVELSTPDRFRGLLFNAKAQAKPNTYYHEIHPTEAAEVDARLSAKPGAPPPAPTPSAAPGPAPSPSVPKAA